MADPTLIISAIILFIAILSFCAATWQTMLAKRMLYGEVYERPPLERVGFLELEAKRDNRVRFNKEINGKIFEEVILPKHSRAPLLITWRTTKKQSLRHVQLGFELGHDKKPRVVRRLLGWVAKEIKPLQMAEYIDLDGYYHIEYQTPRKIGSESPFIVEFEIETGGKGKHEFHVEIYSEEAKKPFKKSLKVLVE